MLRARLSPSNSPHLALSSGTSSSHPSQTEHTLALGADTSARRLAFSNEEGRLNRIEAPFLSPLNRCLLNGDQTGPVRRGVIRVPRIYCRNRAIPASAATTPAAATHYP